MTIITHYHTIGVSSDATTEEITAAFRRKAKQWHPDVCRYPDAEERMKEINEAAEILCNPVRRSKYDESLARETFLEQNDHDRIWREQAKQPNPPRSHSKNPRRDSRPSIKTVKMGPWVSPATVRFAAGCFAVIFVVIILSVMMMTGVSMVKLPQIPPYNPPQSSPVTSTVSSGIYSQSIEQGNKLLEEGDYEGALRMYDAVIARNPDIAQKDVWYNRGIAQNILGRYQDASQSFDHVLTMAPGDSLALGQKGAALLGLGRYNDALYYTDQALVENSDSEWIWNNRGIALKNLGQQKEARAAFDNALVFKTGRSGF
jgi:tetratricopeptide (TPR) repeat protein